MIYFVILGVGEGLNLVIHVFVNPLGDFDMHPDLRTHLLYSYPSILISTSLSWDSNFSIYKIVRESEERKLHYFYIFKEWKGSNRYWILPRNLTFSSHLIFTRHQQHLKNWLLNKGHAPQLRVYHPKFMQNTPSYFVVVLLRLLHSLHRVPCWNWNGHMSFIRYILLVCLNLYEW